MTKRRILKKNVHYISGELFTTCVLYKNLVPDTNEKKIDQLMIKILKVDTDFTARISHGESKNAKFYYKKFHEDFKNVMNGITNELNKLGTVTE